MSVDIGRQVNLIGFSPPALSCATTGGQALAYIYFEGVLPNCTIQPPSDNLECGSQKLRRLELAEFWGRGDAI
jgi:hypothetical protein